VSQVPLGDAHDTLFHGLRWLRLLRGLLLPRAPGTQGADLTAIRTPSSRRMGAPLSGIEEWVPVGEERNSNSSCPQNADRISEIGVSIAEFGQGFI
jgi:hypothetical protein